MRHMLYIDRQWNETVQAPDMLEEDMLSFVQNLRPESRLACQIDIDETLEGLIVYVP